MQVDNNKPPVGGTQNDYNFCISNINGALNQVTRLHLKISCENQPIFSGNKDGNVGRVLYPGHIRTYVISSKVVLVFILSYRGLYMWCWKTLAGKESSTWLP